MLPGAIDITDAALADDGERKEKLTPELPLFRPLQERGTLGLISTGHLPSSPADRRRCPKAESPPRWAGPQGHAALKGMTLLFATWCLSAARGHGAPPSFGRLPAGRPLLLMVSKVVRKEWKRQGSMGLRRLALMRRSRRAFALLQPEKSPNTC